MQQKINQNINGTFARYTENPCERTLADCMSSGEPLVRYYAKVYGGGCCYDDLYQSGMLGVVKAVKKYKAELNVAFVTWASWCIISEIRHYVRKERKYYYPKCVEELHQKLDSVIDQNIMSGHSADGQGKLSKSLGVTGLSEIMKAGLIDFDEIDSNKISSMEQQSFQLPIEERLALEQAMNSLGELQKKVIDLLFFKDMTQQKAAEMLGINQRKVSRLKDSALKILTMSL